MNGLKERRQSFEEKFAQDEALRFKITARRNKLLGLWAAKQLGKSAEDAEVYAKEVISADLKSPNGVEVIRKITSDLGVSKDEVVAKMDELLAVAEDQLTTE